MISPINKREQLIILLHIMVWLMLFSFPYFFSFEKTFNIGKTLEHSWVPLLTYAITFYLNYGLFVNKFLFNKRWLLFFIINLVIIAIFIETRFEIRHLFMGPHPLHEFPGQMPPPPRPLTIIFFLDFLGYTVPVLIAIGFKIYEKWIAAEREKNEAIHSNISSELEQLKYQLQPHFFFNSLNNIYSLVDISPEKAKEMIHSLGKLMRYLLHEANNPKVSLQQEIDFVNKYIDLMEVRFSDHVKIERHFQTAHPAIQVAPLLFISIVENAFKHGVSATQPSFIAFDLEINNNLIVFTSRNTNFPKSNSDSSGSGIGIENLQKRLSLLYKDKHELTTNIINEQFLLVLTIDLNH